MDSCAVRQHGGFGDVVQVVGVQVVQCGAHFFKGDAGGQQVDDYLDVDEVAVGVGAGGA